MNVATVAPHTQETVLVQGATDKGAPTGDLTIMIPDPPDPPPVLGPGKLPPPPPPPVLTVPGVPPIGDPPTPPAPPPPIPPVLEVPGEHLFPPPPPPA